MLPKLYKGILLGYKNIYMILKFICKWWGFSTKHCDLQRKKICVLYRSFWAQPEGPIQTEAEGSREEEQSNA